MLEAVLAQDLYVDSERPEAREGGWPGIQSLDDLDWALGRIADLRREQTENNEVAQARIDNLRMRLDLLNRSLERGISFFEGHVRLYAEQHRAELLGNGKQKSRKLPSGVVSWRSRPAQLEVRDEVAALFWAEANGCAKTKTSLDKAALAERFKATGEVPEGCEVVPEHEDLSIKAGGW